MASTSSASLHSIAYVIESYLGTYPDWKPVNQSDFQAAVSIVDELVREELRSQPSSEQRHSEAIDGQSVRREESSSSSMLTSMAIKAREYLFDPPYSMSETLSLQQEVDLQNAASTYGRSTSNLLRMGFPFAAVSREMGRKWLTEELEIGKYHNLSQVIKQKLQDNYIEDGLYPGNAVWIEIETLVNAVSSDEIGKMFLDYKDANTQQEPLRETVFHILLKMAIWHEHALPQIVSGEECDLNGCFEDSLRSVEYSKHPNPLRLIEIVLAALPKIVLTNDGFRAFVLQMLIEKPFVDWPNKERVLIAYFEFCRDRLDRDAASLAASDADERTAIIGQNMLNILTHSGPSESNHYFSQLMHNLRQIPKGWIESVFNRYPEFNGLCRDYYFTPPCVRRVNLNSYSPVLVIGDLIIGLYESRNRVCVAYHIKTEKVVWTQRLDLNDVQSWMILNTPFGIAIPKQDSNEMEFYDVETGMRKGCIGLPRVYQQMDRVYCTPGGHVYFYCKDEHILFVATLLSSSLDHSTIWQMLDCAGEMVGCFEHCVIFKNKDSIDLVTPNAIKHSFWGCEHLSLVGTKLVRFERKEVGKMEVIIQEISEGSELVLAESPPRSYIVPFGYVQNVSITQDTLIYSTLEGIYFVNLQNKAVREIKRPISPYYTPLLIDSETGTIWMWDKTQRCLYKGSQEGFEPIGPLTSTIDARLLFARDEMLYMIG